MKTPGMFQLPRAVFREDIQVESNVKIIIRERGKIVGHRESHNIVVNQGKAWLRDRLGASLYPSMPTTPTTGPYPFAQYPGDGSWNISASLSPYVMRYCAFGQGGLLNGGTYTENVHIGGLEDPLPLLNSAPAPSGYSQTFMKQALPQVNPTDLTVFPSSHEVCFRFVVLKNELSFAGPVDISEVAAFFSIANPYRMPTVSEYSNIAVPGFAAYNIFEPFPKGLAHVFELLWYWRY